MYVRLAFAVAAHLEPEILIVDEVLAVGDAAVPEEVPRQDGRRRRADGRTVLFVSHNMAAIQRLCTRGLLMDRGRLVMSGSIGEVVAQYRAAEQSLVEAGRFNTRSRSGTGWARVSDIRLVDDRGRSGARRAARRRSGVPDRSSAGRTSRRAAPACAAWSSSWSSAPIRASRCSR